MIEILVVIGLMGFMGVIGFAAYAEYSKTQQVNQIANDIKLLINQARFNSINVVKKNADKSCVVSGTDHSLRGYNVTIDTTQKKLILNQVCEDQSGSTVQTNIVKSINLNPVFGLNSTCAPISFASLSGDLTGGSCTITVTGYGKQKVISVDPAGNVSIN